jgi:hypothetical protein
LEEVHGKMQKVVDDVTRDKSPHEWQVVDGGGIPE